MNALKSPIRVRVLRSRRPTYRIYYGNGLGDIFRAMISEAQKAVAALAKTAVSAIKTIAFKEGLHAFAAYVKRSWIRQLRQYVNDLTD